MVRLGPFLAVLVVAGVLAGCLAPGDDDDGQDVETQGIDHDAIKTAIGEPIVVEGDDLHDHTDPTQHMLYHNMELVSWSALDVTLGENGFANFVFHETDDEDLLFIAIDGDDTAGFNIVDISNGSDPRTLGEYRIQGRSVQEVRVTPDGQWAVMNVQKLPGQDDVTNMAFTDCTLCIHVVDVSDRSAPRLSSLFPVDVVGTHNFDFHEIDDTLYLFYVGQPTGTVPTNSPPGNYIGAARFVDAGEEAFLVDQGMYSHQETWTEDVRSFPHDVIVEEHPLTGQHIAYLSHWDGGAVTVDVSDPTQPMLLDIDTTMEPSGALAIHWFAPEPRARADGTVIAWSAPEIRALESDAGAIRAYNLTDPADIGQIGTWMVPGDVYIPGGYMFSGHITIPDMDRGLLAVSHYHAGVWVLDITDPTEPRELGYYVPHTDPHDPYMGPLWWKKPNFNPDGYLPNVYQVRWHDDLLFVSERGSGLYVLEYTGPIPGAL